MTPVNIEDLRTLSRRRLPRLIYDYMDGGSYDEITLRANRSDYERLKFRPRVLVDVSKRSLETTVFGERLAMPLVLGPVGSIGMLCRRGDIAAARAAERCGIQSTLSTVSVASIEEVRAARQKPFWMQLYLMPDQAHARTVVERAQAAECPVLLFTVDSQVYAARERDVRNGYSGVERVHFSSVVDMLCHPRWIFDVPLGPRIKFGNMPGGRGNFLRVLKRGGGGKEKNMTWQTVDWLRSIWKGKLVVKGILTPEDARLAVEHGADGVVVSNHGGRQLDGAPSTIAMLPWIADAIGGRATVLVDGGIRRGHDVLKAVALGADACLIGRAYAYGLGALGEAGAERAIRMLESDMMSTLALLGCNSVKELDASCLDGESVRQVTGMLPAARPVPLSVAAAQEKAA
jgi:L-lactate dehydrogenase (cytochrome)